MGMYYYSRASVALSTTDDLMTLIAAASRRVRIIELSATGLGTTSAAGALAIQRSTGGTTGGGALTGGKGSTDLPTAASTVNTTWASQPSLSGDALVILGCNANGANYRWVARPKEELEARNSEQISIRAKTGSHNVAIHLVTEEDY